MREERAAMFTNNRCGLTSVAARVMQIYVVLMIIGGAETCST